MRNARKKTYTMDMCDGPILKQMLLFALPLMASSLLQLLFNAADIIVVGRFAGDHSLAAVGSTTSLVNLMVNLFMGCSVGANVLAARFFGAKRLEDLSDSVHTAIAISLLSGIILTIVGMLTAPILLSWMKTPDEVLSLASVYLRTYFLGMTAMMLYNFGAAILRAIGDTKRPLYYLIVAGIINLVFNLFFVIVLHWGVFGVGLATTISQFVSATLMMRCLMREREEIRLHWKRVRIHKDKLVQILKIGLPAGFQGCLFSLSNVFIQSSINSFGATVIAGNSAASNIEGFVYVSTNAFHQAAISFTSQNFGAKKYKRINKILIAALGCAIVIGSIFSFGALLAGPLLLTFYTTSAAVVAAGMVRLSIVGISYPLCGIMDTMVGSLRGMGYSIIPMIVSLLGACGLRILWLATVFQVEAYHSIETIYIIYPISWILTALAHLVTYFIVRKRLQIKDSK